MMSTSSFGGQQQQQQDLHYQHQNDVRDEGCGRHGQGLPIGDEEHQVPIFISTVPPKLNHFLLYKSHLSFVRQYNLRRSVSQPSQTLETFLLGLAIRIFLK